MIGADPVRISQTLRRKMLRAAAGAMALLRNAIGYLILPYLGIAIRGNQVNWAVWISILLLIILFSMILHCLAEWFAWLGDTSLTELLSLRNLSQSQVTAPDPRTPRNNPLFDRDLDLGI